MNTTEFPINLDADGEGLGTLFITDARLLIRPGRPDQYPYSVKHDSAHAHRILCLGNDMGEYTSHIICHADPTEAHQMLDRVFYAFLDGCCLQLWCDAVVSYIVNGETVKTEKYGFYDGDYTQFINVYCNVGEDKTEYLLNTLTGELEDADRFIVVRPDASELGYTMRGFIVRQYTEDGDEDDICQGICGQRICSCAETKAGHTDNSGSWFVA